MRVAVVLASRPYPLGPDPADYDRLARLIADGDGFGVSVVAGNGPTAFRPPLYPVFLGAVYRVTGGSVTAGRLAGAVLGAVTTALVVVLVRRIWGRRSGCVAGAVVALLPTLVLPSTALISEALLLPLAIGAVTVAVFARRWTAAAACGVLCGLAVLTRPSAAAVLVSCVVVLRVWPHVAVAIIASALVVLPWQVRTIDAFDSFVPLSTLDGFNLAGTYNDVSAEDGWPYTYAWRPPIGIVTDRSLDERELSERLRGEAIDHIADHPTAVLEAMVLNSARLLELSGPAFAEDSVRIDLGYGRPAGLLAWASFFVLAGCASIALVDGAWRRAPRGFWFAPVLTWAITVPVLGHTRLRSLVDLYLAVLAALAIAIASVRGTGPWRRARSTGRRWACRRRPA